MDAIDGYLYPVPIYVMWRSTWEAAIALSNSVHRNNDLCGKPKLKTQIYANRGGWQVAFYRHEDVSPPF